MHEFPRCCDQICSRRQLLREGVYSGSQFEGYSCPGREGVRQLRTRLPAVRKQREINDGALFASFAFSLTPGHRMVLITLIMGFHLQLNLSRKTFLSIFRCVSVVI